ncbi:Regulatory protein RecX [Paraglaciecola mesophila]|uniref:Regulatory protein RecX n=1 Tax=Paraglaciecola mesophila TaxID=197222 RepID=A0A857JNG9_9ALTE|nr:regulatory protein RecX [Paraglaciecola mesophila]QHJ13629.1 Regulatory protein RecX [Paraglaciecola mesophila]
MTDNDSKNIKYSITKYLSMREHSCHELLKKLLAKGYERALCEHRISQFSQADIQSDLRYAEMIVRSRVSKGKGEQLIRNELSQHAIEPELIELAITEQNVDWDALALEVSQKKFGNKPAKDWHEQQKRNRFLLYRGFSHEQIRALKSVR